MDRMLIKTIIVCLTTFCSASPLIAGPQKNAISTYVTVVARTSHTTYVQYMVEIPGQSPDMESATSAATKFLNAQGLSLYTPPGEPLRRIESSDVKFIGTGPSGSLSQSMPPMRGAGNITGYLVGIVGQTQRVACVDSTLQDLIDQTTGLIDYAAGEAMVSVTKESIEKILKGMPGRETTDRLKYLEKQLPSGVGGVIDELYTAGVISKAELLVYYSGHPGDRMPTGY